MSNNDSVIQWLNAQPQSSVVFLCFGSMGTSEEGQIKEIAKGLENSGHRFLWTLRKPSGPPPKGKPAPSSKNETFLEALPKGFIDRTADRGKIIGWVPQVDVLAHHAVGGFVSHYGWKSALESVWFGVPMANWPIYVKKQPNASSVVKELAVEIRMDCKRDMKLNTGNILASAEEIEKGINKLMNENVIKTGEVSKKASNGGESSYNWLGRFIKDLIK